MSTKTSFRRVAVIAAMALTLGGFTAISANAVTPSVTTTFNDVTSNPGGSNFPAGNSQTVTVPVTIEGNVSTPTTFTISGGVDTAWTFAQTGGPALSVSPTNSGTGAAVLTVSNTNSGISLATFNLTVTVTGLTAPSTRTITSNDSLGFFGTAGVATLSFTNVAAVNGSLTPSAFTGVTAAPTTGTLIAGNAVTIPAITYGVTLASALPTGGGIAAAPLTHVLNASVS